MLSPTSMFIKDGTFSLDPDQDGPEVQGILLTDVFPDLTGVPGFEPPAILAPLEPPVGTLKLPSELYQDQLAVAQMGMVLDDGTVIEPFKPIKRRRPQKKATKTQKEDPKYKDRRRKNTAKAKKIRDRKKEEKKIREKKLEEVVLRNTELKAEMEKLEEMKNDLEQRCGHLLLFPLGS